MQLTLPKGLGENATISVNSASKAASYSKAPVYTPFPEAPLIWQAVHITMAGDNSNESYAISTETGGIVDGSSGGRFVIDGDIRAAGYRCQRYATAAEQYN